MAIDLISELVWTSAHVSFYGYQYDYFVNCYLFASSFFLRTASTAFS